MEIVNAIASVVAIVISVAAWRLASKTVRLEHQPMIRVVTAFVPRIGVLGRDMGPAELEMETVFLKNAGRGPGLAVIAFDPERSAIIGRVEIVEPLGDGTEEADRLGRVDMTLQPPMVMDHKYELYYQDRLSAWHLTRFCPRRAKIECTFPGAVRRVPEVVKAQATVAKT
jgi:hypothetical protein